MSKNKFLIFLCDKKIKDDEGNWHQMEQYFSQHSKLLFLHGICKECVEEYYTDDQDNQ